MNKIKVQRVDVRASNTADIPYTKGPPILGIGNNFTVTEEDAYRIDYESKLESALEKGEEYTWDDYIEDEVLDMIKKSQHKWLYPKILHITTTKQEFLEKLLKNDKLTDQEKFRFVYSNLDKLS